MKKGLRPASRALLRLSPCREKLRPDEEGIETRRCLRILLQAIRLCEELRPDKEGIATLLLPLSAALEIECEELRPNEEGIATNQQPLYRPDIYL